MSIWIAIIGLSLGCMAALNYAFSRSSPSPSKQDISVYRDQLDEIDRDLARGLLAPDEADRARTEIGRRILSADKQVQNHSDLEESAAARRFALGFSGLTILGAVAAYIWLGVPGYQDLPLEKRHAAAELARSERISQSDAEAAFTPPPIEVDENALSLVRQLREALESRPDDIEGLTLLARNEAALGNFSAARIAQEKLIAAKGGDVTTQDLVQLAHLMVYSAGGTVTAQTDQVLADILAKDPANGAARYYVGLMHAQTGRPDIAFAYMRQLLETGPETAPWIQPIRAMIVPLSQAAGVDYAPPRPDRQTQTGPAIAGPSASDIANARDMSPEDRQAMIEGMVEGLADELATVGGPAEKWAQLIGALAVLGQNDRAAAVLAEARVLFDENRIGLDLINAAAQSAGIGQ